VSVTGTADGGVGLGVDGPVGDGDPAEGGSGTFPVGEGHDGDAGDAAAVAPPDRRRTEIGPPEELDLRHHPVATAVGILALVALFLLAAAGIRAVLAEGERRPDAPRVVVAQVEGRAAAEAQTLLERQGLLVQVEYRPNEVAAPGVVFDQRPVAGAKLEVGSEVTLVVSDGPAGLTLPDVRGAQGTVAASLLQALGQSPSLQPVYDDVVRPGEVVATEPAAGNRADPGAPVTVLVSQGPAPRIVPPIVDRPVGPGLSELGRAGLGLGPVTEVYREGVAPGTVIATDPVPGTPLPPRTPVAVTISGPPDQLKVPPLVGLLDSSARSVVPSGLRLQSRNRVLAPGDTRVGRVIEQSLPPGTPVGPDTPVEIVVGVAPPPTTTTTTSVPGTTAPGSASTTAPR
jgi:serine/threonine-protein kinase